MSGRSPIDADGVTLIGLDGVSWSLVDELVENADVPTLERLVSESAHGTTKSTIPSLTCPALPTLYTGMNAGNLGIFDFIKPDGSVVDYDDVTEPALWDYLSAAEQTMLIGAMRTTHPAPEVNGVFISDVLSTEEEPDYVTPESDRTYGERFHELREDLEAAKKSEEELLETFIEMNDARAEVFLDLLDRDDPSFALLWFGLTDGVQHYFWDDRDALYEFFEALDGWLADILERRSETNVVVVGDHGFGPAIEQQFHLNEALRRAGFLELEGTVLRGLLTRSAYSLSERYVSDRWKRHALEIVNQIRSDEDSSSPGQERSRKVVSPLDTLPGIDWSETVAHASTRKGWGVNIVEENVEGDYETIRESVIEALLDIDGPDGEPAVKDAWRGEEIYWGRYGEQVPDIVFLTHDRLKARPSPSLSLFTPVRGDSYVGSHESSRDAVFMATGPDIDGAASIGDVRLHDVTPTVLWLLGVDVPDHLDGRPVTGLVEGDEDVPTASYPVERYRIRKAIRGIDRGRV